MSTNAQIEIDLQTYNTLLGLWQSENPIKTIKLQFLLATNAILLGFLFIGGGFIAPHLYLPVGACVLNIIWMLSIGRTSLFQKAWKNKLDVIAQQYPDDARFQILHIRSAEAQAPAWLRVLGGVSSKYYLLGAPCLFATAWLWAAFW